LTVASPSTVVMMERLVMFMRISFSGREAS
jgi:hypothetical protein